MKMKKKILITPRPFQGKGKHMIKMLQEKGYHVEYNQLDRRFSLEELVEKIKDADAIITGNDPLDREVLSKADKLKVISKYGVGIDNIDAEFAAERGIRIRKALGANTISVAEMTMQLILSSARNFANLCSNSKHLIDKRIIGSELCGKKLGILGLGAIGRCVAQLAHGFGMEIYGYDPYANADELADYIAMKEFDVVISECDFVSLHLPLVHSTEKLINQSVFKRMKNTSILINTARAGLVEHNDLHDALKNQTIAFAAEDVELQERPEALIALDNYIITPHAASFTKEADMKTIETTVKNIIEVLEGE